MNTKTKNKLLNELDSTDLFILTSLKVGKTQKEISDNAIELGFKPNSLSIIEKRLKSIREKFGAKTSFHLAVIIYGK